MKKTVLREYAKLIAKAGANVQKGQEVFITAELDLADPQEYRERRYEQKKALTECKTVLFLIELSFEKELISSEQCAEWTRHVMNVKNMTAKWRKQDRERFATLQQNRGITPRR